MTNDRADTHQPTTAYELGAAYWADLPAHGFDPRDLAAFRDHDEIPDGDYRALRRLYPAEFAALTPDNDGPVEPVQQILAEYRRGYNEARAAFRRSSPPPTTET